MSGQRVAVIELPPEHRLVGGGNYVIWKKSLNRAMGRHPAFSDYLAMKPEKIKELALARIVISNPMTPAEATKINERSHQCDMDARGALSVIVDSVDRTIADMLPERLTNYQNPEPQELYQWIEQKYGSSTGGRQAEQIRKIESITVGSDEDPMVPLSRLNAALDELTASIPADHLTHDFLKKYGAFKMLHALPPAYSLWAGTVFSRPDLSPEVVLSAIDEEYMRQKIEREKVSGVEAPVALAATSTDTERHLHDLLDHLPALTALLATGERPLGKDGRVMLGKDPNAYCSEHKCFGHNENNCFRKPKKRANLSQVVIDLGPRLQAHLNRAKGSSGLPATSFVVDSGATHTFVNEEELLVNPQDLKEAVAVKVGNNATIRATKKGDVILNGVKFAGAYLVPGMAHNLLSTASLNPGAGEKWELREDGCTFYRQGKPVLTGEVTDGLMVIREEQVRSKDPRVSPEKTKSNLLLWHSRLGHVSQYDVWRKGRDGELSGSWSDAFVPGVCEDCIMGKGTRQPSPESNVRAERPGDVVHVDLWGPSPVTSRAGNKYFLTCYDDYSRRKTIYLLATKAEAAEKLVGYIALVENQLGTTVKTVRSDLGGEFSSKQLRDYFVSRGIQHHTTPPAAHAQNGRVERAHLTIANDIRTLLLASGLGSEFWAEAAAYAVYTRNRVCGSGQDRSPEAIWCGREPKMSHLQPFGSQVFYRDHKVNNKLMARYREGVLLGYQDGSTYYRVLDKETQTLVTTRDAKFTDRMPAKEVTSSENNSTPVQWEISHTGESTEDEEITAPVTNPATEGPQVSSVDELAPQSTGVVEGAPVSGHPGWYWTQEVSEGP